MSIFFGKSFKVSTREQFEAVQIALFAEGCKWSSGHTTVLDYFKKSEAAGKVINVSQRGDIRYLDINGDEVFCEALFEQKVIATLVAPREKVFFDGATYYLDDLREAIRDAGLEAV